jgi:hypothetical protein
MKDRIKFTELATNFVNRMSAPVAINTTIFVMDRFTKSEVIKGATAVISTAVLAACGNKDAVPTISPEQNNSKNSNSADVVVTPEGIGPYTTEYKNGINKDLQEKLKGMDNLNGFSIEISGTANGSVTEYFAGFNEIDGSRGMIRRAFDGKEYKDELLGFEDYEDETGKWTKVFDSNGNPVLLIPTNHAEIFDKTGSVHFKLYPSEYTSVMMVSYGKDGIDVTIKDKNTYESSILNASFSSELSLPEIITKMGLSAEDVKNFATQPDGSVIDKRDGQVAVDAEGKIVSIRYGSGWEVVDGKMQVKDVPLEGLNCVKEGKSCVIEKTDKVYKAPSYEVMAVSTGALERCTQYDANSRYLGMVDKVWVETTDKNHKVQKFPVSFQFMNANNSENSVYIILSFVNNQNSDYTSIGPTTSATPEQLSHILFAGNQFDLFFAKDSDQLLQTTHGKFWKDIYETDYSKRMNDYLNSLIKGTPLPETKTYLLPTNIDYNK